MEANGFELVSAGEGRWHARRCDDEVIVGSLWRVGGGFDLYDLRGRLLGAFMAKEESLRHLHSAARDRVTPADHLI